MTATGRSAATNRTDAVNRTAATNRSAVSSLLNGLVSFWPLHELAATRYDVRGSNHLTATNNPLSANGLIGNASQHVAASTQYHSIASNTSLQIAGSLTVCGWTYLDSKATIKPIVSKWHVDVGNLLAEYRLAYNNTYKRWRFDVCSDGLSTSATSINASSAGEPNLSTWYLAIGWYDASAGTINIQVDDGTVDSATGPSAITAASTAEFMIGGYFSSGYFSFDGRLQMVGLWNRVLTTSERTALYNSGAGLDFPF